MVKTSLQTAMDKAIALSSARSIDTETLRFSAMSATELLASLDANARLGAGWIRDAVAVNLDRALSVSDCKAITWDDCHTALESVAETLCIAAVSKAGMAHATGFETLGRHFRNAFPNAVSNASPRVRKGDAFKPYAGREGWIGAVVHAERLGIVRPDGSIESFASQIRLTARKAKIGEDVTDPTADVRDAPGDVVRDTEPSLPDGIERVDQGKGYQTADDTERERANSIRYTPDGVRLAVDHAVADAIERERLLHPEARRVTEYRNRLARVIRKARALRDENRALRSELVTLKASKAKGRKVK